VEQNKLNTATGQFTTAETSGCANVSTNNRLAEKVCGWDSGQPGLSVRNLLLHKNWDCAWSTQKQFSLFIMWVLYYNYWGDRIYTGLCEPLWTNRPRNDAHIASVGVWLHKRTPGFSHQKTKRGRDRDHGRDGGYIPPNFLTGGT